MLSTMFALVDCNNFYVSCERVFDPKLQNRPVIVLSNNDGCAISRSNEAKQLGIPMGAPLFEIRDLVRKHNVAVLSSNFALYGDLSARVMSIIMQTLPDVEVYSIDEAFIDLTSMQGNFDLYKICVDLVKKLEQYTGIPVSIGIASTKTLAKVANHIAKRKDVPNRVFFLSSNQITSTALKDFKIRDVWGIGWKLEKKLHGMGVQTATDLINLPESVINNNFNIIVQRTIYELQGHSCIALQDSITSKQQIMVSRSFGNRITTIEPLYEAIATYASMACVKLRKQNSVAGGLYVFLNTGLHGAESTIYRNSSYVTLNAPSFDTRLIIQTAKDCLKKLFRSGFRYKKVGIILCDLSSATNMQRDLFGHDNLEHTQELMAVVDKINKKLGKLTVQFAASGLQKDWRMQSAHRSNIYTANCLTLPEVKCK